MFQIEDMECGETFTTHEDYDQLEFISEHPTGEKRFHVNSPSANRRHAILVEAGSTIIQALDSDGNNLYICLPEM